MRSSTVLSIAALAGSSFAQKSDEAFCNSVQSSFFNTVFAALPTTPADILSFVATATGIPALPMSLDPSGHQNQLCALATALPASLLPEFQSFAGRIFEEGKSFKDDLVMFVTDCVPEPAAASMVSYISHVFTATGNICTEFATATATATAAPGSGAGNGTYPTGTGVAYPTASSSSSLIPTAAAARPTAFVAAAAVGGAVYAAAML